jgi:hypothetical protein
LRVGERAAVSSVTACWGREDPDEFQRPVEAFIARRRRPAFTGALAVAVE